MSTPSSTKPVLDHGHWMTRAMELARDGMALAHPNPRVGAVVVRGGVKVGEGFHEYNKRHHAEIVALRQAGEKARGATLYVNLEPCCTTGRTGPCTKAIVAAGVKHVYAAMSDPNPTVAGRGFAELKRAGIAVHLGLCEEETRELNEDFAKWIRTGLPFVTLKTALTLDGQIAASAGSTTWLTSDASLKASQQMRHRSDAILTGIGTVLADDPRMTDRTGEPRRLRLLRAVVDSRLRLPLKSKLIKDAQGDVIVFTGLHPNARKSRALIKAGIEVVPIRTRRGKLDLLAVLRELGKRDILSLQIEGGAKLNGAALQADIVDKMILFYAPRVMGTGGVPMAEIPSSWFPKSPALTNLKLNRHGPDFSVEGYFHDVYGHHRARRKD